MIRSRCEKFIFLSRLVASFLFAWVAAAKGQALPGFKADVPPYTLQEIRVPMAEAGPEGLQVLLALPNLSGRHPVVLMTHDEFYFETERKETGPGSMLPGARWFVLRGWAVAMVMRRANGESGGSYSHHIIACGQDENESLQRDNARELRAAAAFLATRPDLDMTRVIAAGYHMGGAAAMWLAESDVPAGLKAVISFSIGWLHVPVYVDTCIRAAVKPMYADLGSKTRTPMLWVLHAKGDAGGHEEEVAAVDAFHSAGGIVEVEWLKKPTPQLGGVFYTDPVEWTPKVENFLARQGLPSEIVLTYRPPTVEHTPFSNPIMEDNLEAFLLSGPNKALALAPNGYFNFAAGMASLKLAKARAMDRCRDPNCKIVLSAGR